MFERIMIKYESDTGLIGFVKHKKSICSFYCSAYRQPNPPWFFIPYTIFFLNSSGLL